VDKFNKKIRVIGCGEMAHARGFLRAGRHELAFHAIRSLHGHEPVALEPGAAQAGYVINCVPVTPLCELAGRAVHVLNDQDISLRVARGLDSEGRTAADRFRKVYAGRHGYGVRYYGPMLSEAIRTGRPSFARARVSLPAIF
jgi:hypothetical protein